MPLPARGKCAIILTRAPLRAVSSGDVAQLGEHHVRNVGVVGSNPIISTTEMTRASGDRGPLCFAVSVGGDLGRPLSGAVVGCSWEGGASTVPTRGERKGMSMDATTGKALMRAQFKAVREELSVGGAVRHR